MHANDVFLFFKNHFWHQHIKTIQNIQTILNLVKKKIQIFWERSRSRVPERALKLIDYVTMEELIGIFGSFCFFFTTKKNYLVK
jgi:hypothetical protein